MQAKSLRWRRWRRLAPAIRHRHVLCSSQHPNTLHVLTQQVFLPAMQIRSQTLFLAMLLAERALYCQPVTCLLHAVSSAFTCLQPGTSASQMPLRGLAALAASLPAGGGPAADPASPPDPFAPNAPGLPLTAKFGTLPEDPFASLAPATASGAPSQAPTVAPSAAHAGEAPIAGPALPAGAPTQAPALAPRAAASAAPAPAGWGALQAGAPVQAPVLAPSPAAAAPALAGWGRLRAGGHVQTPALAPSAAASAAPAPAGWGAPHMGAPVQAPAQAVSSAAFTPPATAPMGEGHAWYAKTALAPAAAGAPAAAHAAAAALQAPVPGPSYVRIIPLVGSAVLRLPAPGPSRMASVPLNGGAPQGADTALPNPAPNPAAPLAPSVGPPAAPAPMSGPLAPAPGPSRVAATPLLGGALQGAETALLPNPAPDPAVALGPSVELLAEPAPMSAPASEGPGKAAWRTMLLRTLQGAPAPVQARSPMRILSHVAQHGMYTEKCRRSNSHPQAVQNLPWP